MSSSDHQHDFGTPRSEPAGQGQGQGWVLPVLAVERALRAVVLVGIGVILISHARTDWSELARALAQRGGLDPSRNETGKLISGLAGFGPRQARRDGGIAVGYGLLEAVEAYGLARRRQWGEYLTVVSTALLFVPEVQELLARPTDVKCAAFVLNIAIVGYLVIRLIRRRRTERAPQPVE